MGCPVRSGAKFSRAGGGEVPHGSVGKPEQAWRGLDLHGKP
jgi:hypothetical protein